MSSGMSSPAADCEDRRIFLDQCLQLWRGKGNTVAVEHESSFNVLVRDELAKMPVSHRVHLIRRQISSYFRGKSAAETRKQARNAAAAVQSLAESAIKMTVDPRLTLSQFLGNMSSRSSSAALRPDVNSQALSENESLLRSTFMPSYHRNRPLSNLEDSRVPRSTDAAIQYSVAPPPTLVAADETLPAAENLSKLRKPSSVASTSTAKSRGPITKVPAVGHLSELAAAALVFQNESTGAPEVQEESILVLVTNRLSVFADLLRTYILEALNLPQVPSSLSPVSTSSPSSALSSTRDTSMYGADRDVQLIHELYAAVHANRTSTNVEGRKNPLVSASWKLYSAIRAGRVLHKGLVLCAGRALFMDSEHDKYLSAAYGVHDECTEHHASFAAIAASVENPVPVFVHLEIFGFFIADSARRELRNSCPCNSPPLLPYQQDQASVNCMDLQEGCTRCRSTRLISLVLCPICGLHNRQITQFVSQTSGHPVPEDGATIDTLASEDAGCFAAWLSINESRCKECGSSQFCVQHFCLYCSHWICDHQRAGHQKEALAHQCLCRVLVDP
eukprot:ANDGO_08274.mRNA.1 hypothetical protein